jgi:hypothetical protein
MNPIVLLESQGEPTLALVAFNFYHGTCVGASSPKVFYKSSIECN